MHARSLPCIVSMLATSKPGIIMHHDPEDDNHVLYATRYFYVRPAESWHDGTAAQDRSSAG